MGSGCATRVISSGTGVASKQLLFVAVGIRQLSPNSHREKHQNRDRREGDCMPKIQKRAIVADN